MASEDRIRELEDKYEGFKVYDNSGSKIGKVDDLFIDESDREEYVGVKMGLFGSKSTLIPMDIIRVNEADKTLEVSESKDRVKDAPNFNDDEDITPDFEDRIRSHFGLQSQESSSDRGSSDHGSYGAYSGAAGGATGASGDTETDDTRDQDQSGTSSGRGSDRREGDFSEGVSNQSDSSGGDTGEGSGTYERSETSGGEASSNERGSDSDTERESRDSEEMQTADTSEGSGGGTSGSSGASSGGDPETREMPVNRETTETETYQEGGRTKIRRRVRREEVEFVDDDQNR